MDDGLRGVVVQQIHVSAGVERFFEPAAGGKAGDHLGDDGVVGGAVVLVAGELGEHVELEGGGVVAGVGEALDIAAGELLELEVADGGVEGEGVAVGGGELGIVAAEGVVLGGGLAVSPGVEERVGVGLALGGGERRAHGLQLRGGLRGLEGEGLCGVDGAEDGGGAGGVAGELIGARQGVAEVDLLRLRRVGERGENAERALGIVLLQVGGGQLHGRGGGEDAVGVAVGEADQEGVGVAGVAGLDGGLRGEIIGVVGEGLAGTLCLGEVGDGFGVAVVLHGGVAQRKIGGGCALAGMGAGVGEDPGVGGG